MFAYFSFIGRPSSRPSSKHTGLGTFVELCSKYHKAVCDVKNSLFSTSRDSSVSSQLGTAPCRQPCLRTRCLRDTSGIHKILYMKGARKALDITWVIDPPISHSMWRRPTRRSRPYNFQDLANLSQVQHCMRRNHTTFTLLDTACSMRDFSAKSDDEASASAPRKQQHIQG